MSDVHRAAPDGRHPETHYKLDDVVGNVLPAVE
jgi:hypothetical protein